ncbi:hypothetical protein [Psychroflexus lacisalsi]|jgi:hypothetical protein|uniref:hypothetical protein n=1 Tax=Psychroflexus lacisalsi TaxID=503928 RepID=UPI001CCD4842|nr:hypothetical protein [Psychroflexus lacisalsi]MBZ9620347.1 hypothetical protein [Psychroflexus lacisalsi]
MKQTLVLTQVKPLQECFAHHGRLQRKFFRNPQQNLEFNSGFFILEQMDIIYKDL